MLLQKWKLADGAEVELVEVLDLQSGRNQCVEDVAHGVRPRERDCVLHRSRRIRIVAGLVADRLVPEEVGVPPHVVFHGRILAELSECRGATAPVRSDKSGRAPRAAANLTSSHVSVSLAGAVAM